MQQHNHKISDLAALSERVDAIQSQLGQFIAPLEVDCALQDNVAEEAGVTDSERLEHVAELQRSRARRFDYFDANLFADPAWDIILDLYWAALAQVRIPVSSNCVAANTPPTTALRWQANLVDRGLVRRMKDPFDRRRVFLELTTKARNRMDQFVDEDIRRVRQDH